MVQSPGFIQDKILQGVYVHENERENKKNNKEKEEKEQRRKNPRLLERVQFPLLLKDMTWAVTKMAKSLQICHTDSQGIFRTATKSGEGDSMMVFTIKLTNNFYMLLSYHAPEHKNNWSEEGVVDSTQFLKQQSFL